jgi:hypothetical protein
METGDENKAVSRKKFVVWSTGVIAVLTAARYFFRWTPKKNKTTVKMLTQDGKLVEVEVSRLSSKRKKIKNEDIHTWIQRKSTL